MWEIILQIGSIAGPFGIIGGIYLYFERKNLKKLDAEKEYRIARAELAEFELRRSKEIKKIEEEKEEIIRGSRSKDVLEANRHILEELEEKRFSVLGDISTSEIKTIAKVNYYKKLKDHSFFWFLHRNEKEKNIDGPFWFNK